MSSQKPRPTKAQRREAARAQAKALREEEERRARRATITRRSLIGVAGAAVLGGGAWWGYKEITKPEDPPIKPAGQGIMEVKADRSGVPKPVLVDGAWTHGSKGALDSVVSAAPVLDIYFDYACPHCATFETMHAEEIGTLLEQGSITLVQHPVRLQAPEWGDMAMNAMGLVLDKAPEKSLAFHTQAMAVFGRAVQAQDQSLLTLENLVAAATSAGVPSSVSDGFKDAIKGNDYKQWMELSNKAFQERGLKGTPTVYFDGENIDLSTLQTPTALTELINGASPQASGSASPQPGQPASPDQEQPTQDPTEQSGEQSGE
ncbi:thioredoxin domain-containing protein [Actinomyces slackii]|uniref:Protein-disulfide isomerase n=1 Tax=Actinomyces slackii TaxID=52774 RepID=A0A3S4WF84_9ACTO|nr:thioredoxin domain-containing protein [Actinomyces slackii]VEG73586.1 Protein-disulfide isomerase [Actinomyces slackii]